jgi:hypothetical protein
MANDALVTYLNDHLAGAVAALELLEHIETQQTGTPDAAILASVRADIEEDRALLEQLMGGMDIPESTPRQVTAWLTEKVGEVKLRLDDPGHGALQRLEALESISLGIEGKRSLAHALAVAADGVPALAGFDAERMARRAEEQRARLEPLRLEAARVVVTAS